MTIMLPAARPDCVRTLAVTCIVHALSESSVPIRDGAPQRAAPVPAVPAAGLPSPARMGGENLSGWDITGTVAVWTPSFGVDDACQATNQAYEQALNHTNTGVLQRDNAAQVRVRATADHEEPVRTLDMLHTLLWHIESTLEHLAPANVGHTCARDAWPPWAGMLLRFAATVSWSDATLD